MTKGGRKVQLRAGGMSKNKIKQRVHTGLLFVGSHFSLHASLLFKGKISRSVPAWLRCSSRNVVDGYHPVLAGANVLPAQSVPLRLRIDNGSYQFLCLSLKIKSVYAPSRRCVIATSTCATRAALGRRRELPWFPAGSVTRQCTQPKVGVEKSALLVQL